MAMCAELENVSDSEWKSVVRKLHDTASDTAKLKQIIARWGGGLAVLMALIGIIGAVIIKVGFGLSESVGENEKFNAQSEARYDSFITTLNQITDSCTEAERERDGLAERIENLNKATDLEIRAWVREGREADRQLSELHRLQLSKEIERTKLDIQEIKKLQHEN